MTTIDTKKPIKVLVIAGPTAVGKSAFALHAAREFDGEIISCDSMQIYRGMDIGTAKPSEKELAACPHHLIDIADPAEGFSAAKYAKLAKEAIKDTAGRGKLPIVCGGTGLYLDGILYEMDYGAGPANENIRKTLEERAKTEGPLPLHEELKTLDPAAAEEIHPNNAKRIIRALERLKLGEDGLRPFSSERRPYTDIDPLLIGLERPRDELYDRINERVDAMMDAGLVKEVEALRSVGLDSENIAMQAIGYKELFACLDGKMSLSDAVEKIKTGSRHYAKRQFTWFRRYDKMKWLDISSFETETEAMRQMDGIVELWLRRP